MFNTKSIKINGKFVRVSMSGKGRVTVGETTLFMKDRLKNQIEAMSYKDHFTPWQVEMKRLFEKAVVIERKRLKSSGSQV